MLCTHVEVVLAVAAVTLKRTLTVDRLGEEVIGAQVVACHKLFGSLNIQTKVVKVLQFGIM